MKTRDLLVLVVTTCVVSTSWASDAYRFEVAQPLPSSRRQDCLEVGHGSYICYLGMRRPGELIALTCAYSAVGRFMSDTSVSVRPVMMDDQNAAAIAGMTVRVRDIPYEKLTPLPAAILKAGAPWIRSGSGPRRFVDTLDVELDAMAYARTFPHLDNLAIRYGVKRTIPDALTACTVDCILDNAAREVIPIRFVRLQLVGAPTLRGFSRTYPVATPRAHEYCEYVDP